MASKFINIRKIKIRINYEKFNINKYVNKILNNDIQLPLQFNYYNNIQGKINSRSILRSKCILTNRSRAVFNKFGMSRLALKKYGGFGFINGLRKATW